MRDTQKKEIDGHMYRCDMMDVRTAHNTFIELCNALGGPIIKAIADGSDDLEGDATRLVSTAISAAARNLSGPVGEGLIECVFKGIALDEKDGFHMEAWDPKFNEHFKGRLLTMYKVWAWGVEVNYKDFLTGAQALGGEKTKNLGLGVLSSLQTATSRSGQ